MMLCGNRPLGTSIPSLTKTDSKAQRQAAARTAAAKSKSKLWGPSHSFDSDDDASVGKLGAAPRPSMTGSWWDTMNNTMNKAWAEWGTGMVLTTSSNSNGSVTSAAVAHR